MSDRLSDEDVADIIFDGSTMAFQEEIHLLAREVQEWRAKAAADTVQDNPYKAHVEVRQQFQNPNAWWMHLAIDGTDIDFDGRAYPTHIWLKFPTEAEAREHARLIVAALRNVEVEQ